MSEQVARLLRNKSFSITYRGIAGISANFLSDQDVYAAYDILVGRALARTRGRWTRRTSFI